MCVSRMGLLETMVKEWFAFLTISECWRESSCSRLHFFRPLPRYTLASTRLKSFSMAGVNSGSEGRGLADMQINVSNIRLTCIDDVY